MKEKKDLITNILIIIFCLLGSLFCLILFFRDLNASLHRQGEEPVGTITFRFNSAKRRFGNRVAWDRLRNGSALYNGDIIRTADISEATVSFSIGDSVDIYSNTLIQIYIDSNGPRIDISGGALSVRSSPDSEITLVSGGTRIKINSGAIIQASSRTNGNMDIIVNEGTVSLGNGKLIEAGSGLQVNPDGEEIIVPCSIAVSPFPGARYITLSGNSFPVNFIWNKINYPPDGLTRLEIAYDRSFKSLLFSEDTKADRLVFSVPEGTFFWRLYPLADNFPDDIPYSKISVTGSTLPVPISPSENRLIPFQSGNPAVRFIWSSSPEASSYIVEAADNSLMSNPVFHSEVSAGRSDQLSISSMDMGQGAWYWRVIPVWSREYIIDISASEQKSETASFIITGGDIPVTAVPVILVEEPVPVAEEPVAAPPPRPAPQAAVPQRPPAQTPAPVVVTPPPVATPPPAIVERPPEPVVVTPPPVVVTTPPVVVERPPEPVIVTQPPAAAIVQTPPPIVVTPPPVQSLLGVPQNRLPRDSFILRHEVPVSESIAFSWNAVEGANGYILTIYIEQDGLRSVVLVTQVLKESKFTLEDIRTLGRGTFFWQAEAVYAANNGSIERHGELLQNKLIIDVPFPTRIRTGDSGILYGNN